MVFQWEVFEANRGFCVSFGDDESYAFFRPNQYGKVKTVFAARMKFEKETALALAVAEVVDHSGTRRFGAALSAARRDLCSSIANKLNILGLFPEPL
ncbi:hypothetical protein VRZ08_05470 [Rhodopseudomonas sp. G2_2311]|uniref:hypothetical protein n=1 Tax=Rhodopseudomonas sp. G2_2311 TaxID=3114287 RepID=UPI0039C68748